MKTVLSSAFLLIVVISLLGGTSWYISNRLAKYFPFVSKKVWVIIIITLLLAYLLCFAVFNVTADPFGRTFYQITGIVFSLFIMLLFALIAVDLISLVIKIAPKNRGIMSLVLLLALTCYGLVNAFSIKVREVTIPIKGLTKELRVVQLSDVHLGNFRGQREVKKLVRKVNALAPDFVVNTGDLFDARYPLLSGHVLSPFKQLQMPQFFVYGNHDQHVGLNEILTQAKDAGLIVLDNKIAHFGELQIVGLNNMAIDANSYDVHSSPEDGNIKDALAKLHPDSLKPSLVLHHRPVGEEYMQAAGSDLLLAGHTHAGQIFPITFVAQMMFKYNKGLYNYKDMKIYVSEGSGTIFYPIRLGTRSEITLITLVPEK